MANTIVPWNPLPPFDNFFLNPHMTVNSYKITTAVFPLAAYMLNCRNPPPVGGYSCFPIFPSPPPPSPSLTLQLLTYYNLVTTHRPVGTPVHYLRSPLPPPPLGQWGIHCLYLKIYNPIPPSRLNYWYVCQ